MKVDIKGVKEQTIIEDYAVHANPFFGTSLEKIYGLGSKKSGEFGEFFASEYLKTLGYDVTPRTNVGNDFVVDGIKVEHKYSMCQTAYLINHISVGKDWDRLIFTRAVAQPYIHMVMYFFNRQDFLTDLENGMQIFSYQQGGDKIKNDDYMFSGSAKKFNNAGIFKSMDEW